MPKEIRSSSWRQGQVLPDEAVRAFNLAGDGQVALPDVVAVVVTHDCDLVAHVDREPDVEILVGRRISTFDGNLTHGKSPRILHLGFRRDAGAVPVALQARAKRRLDKSGLAAYAPDTTWSLDADDLSILQRWLASRYRRAAFPEAFETCLKDTGLDKALVDAVKPLGALVRAVYFDVTEPEVAMASIYELGIVLVYDARHVHGLAQAERAAQAIEKRFRGKLDNGDKPGMHAIEFRFCEAVSDEVLTYKQSLGLKQWRLDYLSLRDDPQQSMPD